MFLSRFPSADCLSDHSMHTPSSYEENEEIKTASGEITELAVVAEGEERTTWFVWLLVFATSISGLLFGMS